MENHNSFEFIDEVNKLLAELQASADRITELRKQFEERVIGTNGEESKE